MNVLSLGWRTRDQLLKLHGNNANLVDNIIERKVQRGEFKDHPDCPDDESALLYYCLVDLGNLAEDEVEEKMSITADLAMELGSQAVPGGS